jgi:hypothetical protein
VDEEEAIGLVFLLDFGEAGVVGAPVGMLKVRLEEVAFGDVDSAAGGDGAEFVHAAMHRVRSFPALRNV